MSVYNRKMFKRNARKALDQAAGGPPVQMFQAGGPVNAGVGYQTFTSPLTGKTYRGAVPSGRGVTSLQPFDIATRYIQGGRNVGYGDDAAISPGEYATLQAYQSAYQAGQSVKDPTDTRLGGAVESVLNPAARVAAGGGAFVRGLATQGLQSLLSSDKQMPEPLQLSFEPTDAEKKVIGTKPDGSPLTAGEKVVGKRADGTPITAYDQRVANEIAAAKQDTTLGQRVASLKPGAIDQDYLTSLGIFEIDPTATSAAAGPQAAQKPKGIFQGPMPAAGPIDDSPESLERIRAEREARKQMETQGIAFTEEETGQIPSRSADNYMAGLIMDDIAAANQRKGEDFQAAVDAADRDEADVDLAKMKAEQAGSASDGGDGSQAGAGDGTQAGDGTDTEGDGETSVKEEVQRVITEGTPEEQQSELERLMKEFTDNAPEYEGMNQGLALAKIGFAMAAGKSPNAIENIANAMEQGADMLIKDKSKRDEFNRQVQLSALQYGLKDIAAQRQQERAAEFQTTDYVLMPGEKYTTPDGRVITGGEQGTTISLRKSDVLQNGLPEGVQGSNMAVALLNKKATLEAAIAKANADGIKSRTLDTPKKITEYVDDYSNAVTDVINANNAMHLTKQVMIMNAEGKITGFQPGFNSMIAKAMAAAGVDATSYTDRDLAIADLRKVFQKLVPLTLGKDQSANSISNQDVNRLADAYMSDAVLKGGVLGLMTTPANVLDSKLSGILVEFQNAQDDALGKLTSLEETGAEFLTPSGAALGSRVSAQRKRLQPFLPGGSKPMFSVGDDGVYRRV
jgi:hypothetical protein